MGMLSKKDQAHIHNGAWYKTVNEPIPAHIQEHAARRNPLYGAKVVGRMTAEEYRNRFKPV